MIVRRNLKLSLKTRKQVITDNLCPVCMESHKGHVVVRVLSLPDPGQDNTCYVIIHAACHARYKSMDDWQRIELKRRTRVSRYE